jgi:murein hydrolase activator
MKRRFPRLLLIGGLVLVAALAALAQPASERTRIEALAARATERLQSLQREADSLASQERSLLGELRRAEIERQMRSLELQQVTADEDAVAADLSSITDRLGELSLRERNDEPILRARLVELYKLGQGRYLRLLLSTADVRKLGQASRVVAALARIDRERFAEHQRTAVELARTRGRLAERRRQLAAVRADAERVKMAADRAVQARNALITEIDSRRDLNAQFAGELQDAQQRLQLALRGLAAGATHADVAPLPLRAFRGDLDWPVNGTVRQRYGQKSASLTSGNGMTLMAPEGTPVAAIHEGQIAFADSFAGFGKLVIVDHGERVFSLYGNLLEIAVARGSRVERGGVLGSVGRSPAGPAELYFELRVDDRPVDPLQWLRDRR